MSKLSLRRLCHGVVVSGLVACAATVTLPSPAGAATSDHQLILGGVGDVAALDRAAGKTVARHPYGNFQGSVPTGQMITVNAQGLPWRQVASVAVGSALHTNIVRWADTIKSRKAKVQLAFGHEPELSSKKSMGTPEEFKNAYRRVVQIFRNRGVSNVQWVFQTSDWAYRTNVNDYSYAGRWYPGDSYVDIIGGDAYNWHTCGEGRGRDVPLSTVAGGVVSFARAHGKLASLPEFGVNSTVKRDKWLREGYAWLKANSDVFVSAFYFNHPPTNLKNSDCNWPLKSSAEYAAFKEIASDGWVANY